MRLILLMWFLDIIMKHEFKGLEDFFEGIYQM